MAPQKKSVLYNSKSNNHATIRLFDSIGKDDENTATVHALLQEGADIDAKDSRGLTPLLLACKRNHKETALLLIQSGANVAVSNSKACTVLHQASERGWTRIVRAIVDEVPDVDATNTRGQTSMHLAAGQGRLRVVQCLMQAGAHCNRRDLMGYTPLLCAAQFSKEGVFDLILESGVKVDGDERLLIYYASRNRWTETVQFLVERVPELNARYVMGETNFDATSSRGHLEIVRFLTGEENNNHYSVNGMISQEALYCASCLGHLEVVKWLVKRAADKRWGLDLNGIHKSGNTALHFSSSAGHLELVKYLVEEGASIGMKNHHYELPLHEASACGQFDVLKWLLEKCAEMGRAFDIHARNKSGCTALHLASTDGHLEIVKCLVEGGADINAKQSNRETPLLGASCNGHHDVVKYLVEKGAEINAETLYGATSILLAAENNHKEVVDLLICCGANLECGSNPISWSILHSASEYGWMDIVESYVKDGRDLNVRDEMGCTALDYACFGQQLHTAQVLLQAGARWDIEDMYGDSLFQTLLKKKNSESIKLFTLLFQYGAFLKPTDYNAVECCALEVLQTVNICCQSLINQFNNHDLNELYKLSASGSLPRIEELKITNGTEVYQAIEKAVTFEIQSKGHCNVLEVRPLALSILSVQSFLKYCKKEKLKMGNQLKRPAPCDSKAKYHSCKKICLH